MKDILGILEKRVSALVYGIIGILLILFPSGLTNAIPFMVGIAMLVHGVIGLVSFFKHKKDSDVNLGKVIILLVLGSSIVYHDADAIGAIGIMWAFMSLNEVAEEITEAYRTGDYSVFRMIFVAITIILAVLLMFDPFEHFTFHVRILGLEMLVTTLVRKHGRRSSKSKEEPIEAKADPAEAKEKEDPSC